MSRKVWFSIIIVVAFSIALLSLAYPSIVTSNVSVQSIPSFATYTSQYVVGYPEISASTYLAGYSSSTAWYPGNFICDPASNACTPYPTPTATFVYPQSATATYQVTFNSESSSTYTTESTLYSSQTSFQSVPPYAVAGLTDFQFGISALIIIAIIGLILLYLNLRREPAGAPEKPTARLHKASAKICSRCGAENSRTRKFCTNCGSQLD